MEIATLVAKDIQRVNRCLPEGSRIAKYVLLHKEFDPDEAELTRSRKLRRQFIEDSYRELIDAVYQGEFDYMVETVVTYQDGRKGVTRTRLRVNCIEE